MKHIFPVIACTALLCAGASAEPLRFAQAAAPELPPPGTPAKPKPAKPKPKPPASGSATSPNSALAGKKDQGYLNTLQAPRRIRKEDMEDDPSGPATPRLRPMMTPDGRPAMGGSF